jgi:hypothetical protein
VLFLLETKHDGKWLEWLRWRLGFTSMVAVGIINAHSSYPQAHK